jgi:thiamine biosynthesis lipoprotein
MAMGSPCELQVFASDSAAAQRAIDAVTQDVERLEARYSRYRETSFLSHINRVAAAGGSVDVDAETGSLLDYAATCFEQSGGLFDVTSGLLRKAWDFRSGALPDRAQVTALMPRIGWNRVAWQAPTLRFSMAGMELDFGGIVKEYAADRAAAICRQQGVRAGLVSLGGDIGIVGPRPDGDAWRIGLRHPEARDATMGAIELRDGGLATSGDYERCIVVDGKRYGHILNPRTGEPVGHLASVTVHAEHCVVAGSASTIAMLKEADGPAWLAALGLGHFWIDAKGRCGGSFAPPN